MRLKFKVFFKRAEFKSYSNKKYNLSKSKNAPQNISTSFKTAVHDFRSKISILNFIHDPSLLKIALMYQRQTQCRMSVNI